LALVCDRDPAVAEAVGREFNVPWCTDLEQVLASEVSAIALFTPPAGRAGLIRRCLDAGKDVMTTKPFELDALAAAEVLDAARAMGRVVHLNSPAPGPAPDLRALQAWRERFDLGQPVALRAEAWANYRELADGSWYDDPVRCPAAPMFRIGIYLINDAVSLLGPVAQVHLMTSRLRTGRPTPDQVVLTLRHVSGALSAITASFCVDDGAAYRNSLTVNFERGTAYRNVGASVPRSGADLQLVMTHPDGGTRIAAAATFDPLWSGEYDWDGFVQAVQARRPLSPADAAIVVNGVRVVQAMAESERTGLPVVVT
jgi:predicted dehydrogenase